MSDTTELCGSTYHGHTCRRPAGHRSDMKLIDREQCSARWGGGGITWRTEQAPPVAPEEAVRLVDALLHAADDKAPVFEKRRALLNYMDKQQAEIEETRESWRTVQKMYAALTAEKEAMQKVVAATERYVCRWGGGGITWRTEQAPPVAPEEAVGLVDALTQAAYQKGSAPHASLSPKQLLEARTALLNYIAQRDEKLAAWPQRYDDSVQFLQARIAALTAEKEAMRRALKQIAEGRGPFDIIESAKQIATDALTPKPPTDSTEAPKP